MSNNGLTICYTGDGKGKTTAAIGLVARAIGRKKRVLFVQFMKNMEYGEHVTLSKLQGVTYKIMGSGFCKICGDDKPLSVHKKSAEKALAYSAKAIHSGNFDMVVLDEINCALSCKLLKVKDVIALLKQKPKSIHLVLTGRNVPQSVIKCCDLVSEVKSIKHPFSKGVLAQEGIEF